MTEPADAAAAPRPPSWWRIAARILPLIGFGIFLWREKPWRIDVTTLPKLPLLGVLGLYFGAYLPLKGVRWHAVLHDPPPFKTIMAATLEGILAGIVVGFGANDLVRSARLRGTTRFAGDLGSALAQRCVESAAMAIIVAATAAFGPMNRIVGLLAGLMVLGWLALALSGRALARRLEAWHWPRVAHGLRSALDALTWGKIAWITLLALAGWAAEVVMIVLTLGAFGLPADVATATIILIGINAAVALPGPPANLGTFEAGIVAAMYWRGLQGPTVLAFAVTYHLLNVLPVASLASVVFLYRGAAKAPPGG